MAVVDGHCAYLALFECFHRNVTNYTSHLLWPFNLNIQFFCVSSNICWQKICFMHLMNYVPRLQSIATINVVTFNVAHNQKQTGKWKWPLGCYHPVLQWLMGELTPITFAKEEAESNAPCGSGKTYWNLTVLFPGPQGSSLLRNFPEN